MYLAGVTRYLFLRANWVIGNQLKWGVGVIWYSLAPPLRKQRFMTQTEFDQDLSFLSG